MIQEDLQQCFLLHNRKLKALMQMKFKHWEKFGSSCKICEEICISVGQIQVNCIW